MMVRLLYTLSDGFEGVADRPTFEEARALVNDAMTDWTIFELTEPGRYATRGKTLADVENPEGLKDSGGTLLSPGEFKGIHPEDIKDYLRGCEEMNCLEGRSEYDRGFMDRVKELAAPR